MGYPLDAITDITKERRDVMNIEQALQCLIVFNEWRRGERDDCDEPKVVGKAIDLAIKVINESIDNHVKESKEMKTETDKAKALEDTTNIQTTFKKVDEEFRVSDKAYLKSKRKIMKLLKRIDARRG